MQPLCTKSKRTLWCQHGVASNLLCFVFSCPADDGLSMALDGYNLYSYMIDENEKWARDHLIFHIKPKLRIYLNWNVMILVIVI